MAFKTKEQKAELPDEMQNLDNLLKKVQRAPPGRKAAAREAYLAEYNKLRENEDLKGQNWEKYDKAAEKIEGKKERRKERVQFMQDIRGQAPLVEEGKEKQAARDHVEALKEYKGDKRALFRQFYSYVSSDNWRNPEYREEFIAQIKGDAVLESYFRDFVNEQDKMRNGGGLFPDFVSIAQSSGAGIMTGGLFIAGAVVLSVLLPPAAPILLNPVTLGLLGAGGFLTGMRGTNTSDGKINAFEKVMFDARSMITGAPSALSDREYNDVLAALSSVEAAKPTEAEQKKEPEKKPEPAAEVAPAAPEVKEVKEETGPAIPPVSEVKEVKVKTPSSTQARNCVRGLGLGSTGNQLVVAFLSDPNSKDPVQIASGIAANWKKEGALDDINADLKQYGAEITVKGSKMYIERI